MGSFYKEKFYNFLQLLHLYVVYILFLILPDRRHTMRFGLAAVQLEVA